MSSAAASLWESGPRMRPLRFKGHRRIEELTSMQRVYVADTEGEWRFYGWMHAGRCFAMLLCANPACRNLHMADEERIRVDA